MRSLFICFFATMLLYACSPAEEFTESNHENSTRKVPGSVTIASDVLKEDTTFDEHPELIFSKDSTQTLTRDIYPGDILTVRYDLKRMNECEASGRNFLQYLTGFYQVDDQTPRSFDYIPSYTTSHRPQYTKIKVPEGKQLSFWFHSVDTNGCETWDSNMEQNYVIPIAKKEIPSSDELTKVVFQADGEVTQNQALSSVSKVLIQFDIKRLNECESIQNQIPQWGIMGHFKTDLSDEKTFIVTENIEGELKVQEMELEIPEGNILYVWFTATNRYGCFQEDEGASFDLK